MSSQLSRSSLYFSAAVAGIFAFWGGWSRRWISDDGLIVLRTVRNILAGNGPVFNVGERVEANTSTLWQYLIAAFSWLPGMELEDVAMWLALLLTVGAAVVATVASSRMWGGVVAPMGILIYLALPPARDFATAGLEWGLSLFWVAVWWALLLAWADRDNAVVYVLAFFSGLSWLVRPELALYGGLTGIVLLAMNWGNWKRIGLILAAALPLPAGYQIFRMGYYGLLAPHTAVAKSATDSAWSEGIRYTADLFGAYALWVPIVLAVGLGAWFARNLRSRVVLVAVLVVVCAFIYALYVVRVGGDFMHGRMLLIPLFTLLLPVMVVPLDITSAVAGVMVTLWTGLVVLRGHDLGFDPFELTADDLTVVDEREFWTAALHRESGDPPRYAEDFRRVDLIEHYRDGLKEAKEMDAAVSSMVLVETDPNVFHWFPRERMTGDSDLAAIPLTAVMTNLGMTSMNAGLDVRVLDDVGLSSPLAARQPRETGGRSGHDKTLPEEWQLADSAVDVDKLPDDMNKEGVRQARAALRTPELSELLATSREPMSFRRFVSNMKFSLTKGHSLQMSRNPADYLDEETLERIRNGEDVGLHGQRIYWGTSRLE